jgi:PhoH-like ATPase
LIGKKGINRMPDRYILDTNVLLHDPNAILAFQENEVILPLAVVEEIDNQKKRQDEIGRNARVVSQKLDALRAKGNLAEGVSLPNGGRLSIELNHQEWRSLPSALDSRKFDNRILAVAHFFNHRREGRTVLVTKDLNLRIKADVLGIQAEDFQSNSVNYHRLYNGVGDRVLPAEALNLFYREGQLKLSEPGGELPHQFFVLRSQDNPSQSALARYYRGTLFPLAQGDSTNWGIKAMNKEQKFALELLLNDQVKVVTLVGKAGTGKTLLALAVGLEQVIEKNLFTRLLITRPVIPMGQDLGYLPGSKGEKLRPWMQPIFDNLEFLSNSASQPSAVVEDLMERGRIEMEALTYIRGRSIPRQFILCDEAQNLSPHMIKTLITRVGRGSKIVFTGDPEQIDHPYLDANSNGLSYLVEKLKGEEITGHVTLVKGERSQVAELGARLL